MSTVFVEGPHLFLSCFFFTSIFCLLKKKNTLGFGVSFDFSAVVFFFRAVDYIRIAWSLLPVFVFMLICFLCVIRFMLVCF